jgi:hypothetical protein
MNVFWLICDLFCVLLYGGYAVAYAGWGLSLWGQPEPGALILCGAFIAGALFFLREAVKDAEKLAPPSPAVTEKVTGNNS